MKNKEYGNDGGGGDVIGALVVLSFVAGLLMLAAIAVDYFLKGG